MRPVKRHATWEARQEDSRSICSCPRNGGVERKEQEESLPFWRQILRPTPIHLTLGNFGKDLFL